MTTSDAQRLARELMAEHGLTDWIFKFDNAKRRFGQCNYTSQTISLSRHLVELNEWEIVRKTVIHEIAHALVGPRHGHDRVWRAKARELGHSGARCYSDSDTNTVKGKYVFACPAGHEMHYFRLPKRRGSCTKCNPHRYDERHVFSPVGLSSDDQRRWEVKEKAREVKTELMKEIAQGFRGLDKI